MLQLTGEISTEDIVYEIFQDTVTRMEIYVRMNSSNRRELLLEDGSFVLLNECSQYKPATGVPSELDSWYGYNHNTVGVTGISITGDNDASIGDTKTYTATLNGTVLTAATIAWFKFENDTWSGVIGTGSTVSITWTKVLGSKVRAQVLNSCNDGTIYSDKAIQWYCVAPNSAATLYGPGTLEQGTTETYYLLNDTSTNTDKVVTYEKSGNLTILSYTSNSLTILANATGSVSIRAIITNHCGTYTTPWGSLTVIPATIPPVCSEARTASIQRNNCSGGLTGTYVSVSRSSCAFSASDLGTANNLRDISMQEEANTNGSCVLNCVQNQQLSQNFTKSCSSGTGSVVTYTVYAGTYCAADQAAANTLAQNDINANGQNYANAQGTCSGGCLYDAYIKEIFLTKYNFENEPVTGNVKVYRNNSYNGYYNVKVTYGIYYQEFNNIQISGSAFLATQLNFSISGFPSSVNGNPMYGYTASIYVELTSVDGCFNTSLNHYQDVNYQDTIN